MKKDGFVFIESIVVIIVVALSLALLISSYSLVSRKTKEKEKYDLASDKYLLYALSKVSTNNECNYAIDCNIPNQTTSVSFRADIDDSNGYSCTKTKMGLFLNDCEKMFEDMNIEHIYVVENIRNELNDLDSNGEPKTENDIKAVDIYDSGTIEYMKTLKKCNDENLIDEDGNYINNNRETDPCIDSITYMIGVFKRGRSDYYYASIEL